MAFEGFSEKTIDFLWELGINNNKPWFEEHRSDYKTYLEIPMKQLLADLTQKYGERFPQYELRTRISRIYRDARRIRSGGPFRNNMWLELSPFRDRDYPFPEMWFGIDPENWSYGLGFNFIMPELMERFRKSIDDNPNRMSELDRLLDTQSEFAICGEYYKKTKVSPDAPLARWYNLRSFYIGHSQKVGKEITDSSLCDRIVEGFSFLEPFYSYFLSL